ncbi:Kunitz trypsin inhibitor [Thalictrum thalictroides]|uniref:Kunitz trypsin inhibitor n=1 Tax=Thalictrum thalictroides TaxID=46969 RepID=A0A7J6UUZ9_THATH|nr:Kunitz trypsin inhibitor [Thalictrum thalictroides]
MLLKLLGAVTLLWLVLANPLFIVAQTLTPVLDTAGQPLRPGPRYYIVPNASNRGGTVTLVTRNNSCPLFVGQENSVGAAGLPVIFSPDIPSPTIGESRDVAIRFDASTTCVQSTEWALESNPSSQERTLITTKIGNANRRLWLRIDRDANGYKLVFCPSNCPTCRFRCGDVGVYTEKSGRRILALYYPPALPVVFRKA